MRLQIQFNGRYSDSVLNEIQKFWKRFRNHASENQLLPLDHGNTNKQMHSTLKKHNCVEGTMLPFVLFNGLIGSYEQLLTIIESYLIGYSFYERVSKKLEPNKTITIFLIEGDKMCLTQEDIIDETDPKTSILKTHFAIKTFDDGLIAKRYLQILENARRRNLKFELTLKKLKQLYRVKKCQISGVEFTIEPGGDLNMSVDRLDNTIGYTDSNVIAISKSLNQRKSDMSLEEIRSIYLIAKRKGCYEKSTKS